MSNDGMKCKKVYKCIDGLRMTRSLLRFCDPPNLEREDLATSFFSVLSPFFFAYGAECIVIESGTAS